MLWLIFAVLVILYLAFVKPVTYDIVYSIPVHEDIPCIKDLLNNIFNIHRDKFNVCVILHMSNDLWNSCDELRSLDHVYINPSHFDSKLPSHDLVKKHIENFQFAESMFSFKLFSCIASNCMFFKSPDPDYIQDLMNEQINISPDEICTDGLDDDWPWKKLINNDPTNKKKLCDKKIGFHFGTIEGWTVNYTIFKQMIKLIDELHIDSGTINYPSEEVIFEGTKRYLTGKAGHVMCKVYYHQPAITEDIFNHYYQGHGEKQICILKRVPRNIDDPIRLLFRNLS